MSDSSDNQSILDDVSTTFKSLITERFTSPFLFSFAISWLIFNHKLMILGFSDATDKFPIEQKLKFFDSVLNRSYLEIPFTDKTLLLNGFIFPLISAFFYTFVYPFADYYITKFTLERKISLRNLRVKKEQAIYYTFDDVQKIYSKHAEDEKRWKLRLEQSEVTDAYKDSIIKELQSKIDSSNKQTQKEVDSTQEDNNTRLDLARAYIDMGDLKGASEILNEVIVLGTANQKRRAKSLMKKLPGKESSLLGVNNKNGNGPILTKSEMNIVNMLGNAANNMIEWVREKDVMKLEGLTPVEAKIAIDDLYTKNLIKREFNNEHRGFALQLSVDGMKQLKKSELESAQE